MDRTTWPANCGSRMDETRGMFISWCPPLTLLCHWPPDPQRCGLIYRGYLPNLLVGMVIPRLTKTMPCAGHRESACEWIGFTISQRLRKSSRVDEFSWTDHATCSHPFLYSGVIPAQFWSWYEATASSYSNLWLCTTWCSRASKFCKWDLASRVAEHIDWKNNIEGFYE